MTYYLFCTSIVAVYSTVGYTPLFPFAVLADVSRFTSLLRVLNIYLKVKRKRSLLGIYVTYLPY